MKEVDITGFVQGVAAVLWGIAAIVFIYTELTLPAVIDGAVAGCVRSL